ncbi:hypothetical protein HPB48_013821 [Haemaphysalis longicornis]|uniref:Uncharacterized protein n=1 Tax=Haemaphysalis longicornis TaxID=44386 RepID=A0A9J6FVL9_HAELO|nr:hypothetical protein HPB48_013821 [Haemaphysalis longicornis]
MGSRTISPPPGQRTCHDIEKHPSYWLQRPIAIVPPGFLPFNRQLVNPGHVSAVTRPRDRPRKRNHPARDSTRLGIPQPIPEDLHHGTAMLRPVARAKIVQARPRGVVKRVEKRASDVEA